LRAANSVSPTKKRETRADERRPLRKQELLPSVLEEDRASGLSPCPTALITVATTVTALARQ
jgi:hypothetical protein